MIGLEEKETPRRGMRARVSDWERDSIDYRTQTEWGPVVPEEKISALPDLAGYWKYGKEIVPFRFDFVEWKRVAEGFIPRRTTPNPPRKSTAIATNGETKPPTTGDQKSVWELLREEN
jgi:hypothetical protein